MAETKERKSWRATLWTIAALVFAGIFAVDYWLQGDAIPLYSFAYGFLSGGFAILALSARSKARKKQP